MHMPNAETFAITRGRWDIYGPVHKGLRLAQARLLTRLGAADFDQPQPELLAELDAYLPLADSHLAHEETHIHPALDARAAGGAHTAEEQHTAHRARLAHLRARAEALKAADGETAALRGRELYLAFSVFVAEDLEHMNHEETVIWPTLCGCFTDAELMQMEMTIVSSLPPAENFAFMRLMIPAMNRRERAGLLGGIKSGAPPEVWQAILAEAVRPTLPPEDLAHLEALGLAA